MSKISMLYVLDDDGNPAPVDLDDPQSAIDWAQWRHAHHRECVVAKDSIHDASGGLRYEISTVFTGMNIGLDLPTLWETVITACATEDYEHYASYASRVEAAAGHQRALAYFRGQIEQRMGS